MVELLLIILTLLQEADFETLGGQRNVRLDRLAAGANHSHVLVVRPLRAGYFNFTAAEVKYRPSEEVEQIQLGFSSNPGQALIIELKDYEKQFSAHMVRFEKKLANRENGRPPIFGFFF